MVYKVWTVSERDLQDLVHHAKDLKQLIKRNDRAPNIDAAIDAVERSAKALERSLKNVPDVYPIAEGRCKVITDSSVKNLPRVIARSKERAANERKALAKAAAKRRKPVTPEDERRMMEDERRMISIIGDSVYEYAKVTLTNVVNPAYKLQ